MFPITHHLKRGRKLSSCAIACKDDTIEVLRAAKVKPVMVISPAELTCFFLELGWIDMG
jgi:hypothetical protein